MKKLFILFALFLMSLSGYSQDTISVLKGIKPKMRSAGQDTLVSFIAHNTNTGGNAGFVASAGNDTLILRIDSAGVFRIEKAQSVVIASGNVGIGLNNPSEILEVDGNVRGDTAKFLSYVGHSDFTIGSSTSDVTFDSDTIFLKSSATKIYKDGSNELTFTDGVSGTKTLSQLSAASGTMIGEITMYFGDIAIFPTATHALCDGANGTPDLRGRFIRGWSDAVGQEFSGSSARRNNTQVDATAMPTSALQIQ